MKTKTKLKRKNKPKRKSHWSTLPPVCKSWIRHCYLEKFTTNRKYVGVRQPKIKLKIEMHN